MTRIMSSNWILTRFSRTMKHLGAENFLGAEDPDLVDDDPNTPLPDLQGQSAGDPEYKHTIESLNIEDKHIILETDDDKLVECTLKWISMCNKNVQQKIKDSFCQTRRTTRGRR